MLGKSWGLSLLYRKTYLKGQKQATQWLQKQGSTWTRRKVATTSLSWAGFLQTQSRAETWWPEQEGTLLEEKKKRTVAWWQHESGNAKCRIAAASRGACLEGNFPWKTNCSRRQTALLLASSGQRMPKRKAAQLETNSAAAPSVIN